MYEQGYLGENLGETLPENFDRIGRKIERGKRSNKKQTIS